jgi:hypothetical protein
VGGKEWFRADVLGNCDAADPTTTAPTPAPPDDDHDSTLPVDQPTPRSRTYLEGFDCH